jgi:hypothetical protein
MFAWLHSWLKSLPKFIHLCWWFEKHDLPIPPYFVGGMAVNNSERWIVGDNDNADPDLGAFDTEEVGRTDQPKETNFALRFQVSETGAGTWNPSFALYGHTSDAIGSATLIDTGTTTTWAQMVPGTPTDGDPTTAPVMTAGPGAWQNGEYSESDATDQISGLTSEYTEVMFSLQFTASASDETTYYFWIKESGGADLDNYNETSTCTVATEAVATVPVTVNLDLITSTSTTFALVATGAALITAALITAASAMFAPTITGAASVTADLITANSTVYEPTVTTVTPNVDVYVRTDSTTGGDGTEDRTDGATRAFESLADFQANYADKDLTDGGGNTLTVHCSVGDSTAADTTAVTLTGWTTDSDHDLTIRQADSDRHSGVWSDSLYRQGVVGAGSSSINLADCTNFTLDGLQMLFNNTTTGRRCFVSTQTGAFGVTIKNCIAKAIIETAEQAAIQFQGSPTSEAVARIYNNLVYGFSISGGIGINIVASNFDAYVENNTVYGCDTGVNVEGAGPAVAFATNNIVRDSTTGFSGPDYDSSSDYNSADDDTATTLNLTKTSGSPWNSSGDADSDYFLDAASDDFRPGVGDFQIDVGDDLSSIFTTDCVGTDRGTGADTWDLGYFEFVVDDSVTVDMDVITSTSTMYEPVVTGAAAVTADLISSTATVYDPTLTGKAALTADLISAASVMFAPTVTGKAAITADLISATSTAYDLTATGKALVTADLIASTSTVYDLDVDTGAGSVLVNLDLITAASAMFAETVTGKAAVTADLITAASTMFELDVDTGGGSVQVNLDLIVSASTVYDPNIAGKASITADLIQSASAMYEPTLAGKSLTTLGLIISSSTTYDATATGAATTTLDLITAASNVFALTVNTGGEGTSYRTYVNPPLPIIVFPSPDGTISIVDMAHITGVFFIEGIDATYPPPNFILLLAKDSYTLTLSLDEYILLLEDQNHDLKIN